MGRCAFARAFQSPLAFDTRQKAVKKRIAVPLHVHQTGLCLMQMPLL